MQANGGAGPVYARIYKNGVAFGTLRTTSNVFNNVFTENLAFSVGDKIQLYIWTDPSRTCDVKDFKVSVYYVPSSVELTLNQD